MTTEERLRYAQSRLALARLMRDKPATAKWRQHVIALALGSP